jgi:hypothetical protein
MTSQLKNDIKTILEVLTFIIISLSISFIPPWIAYILFALWIGRLIYTRYYIRTNQNIIAFPTLNDEYAKMTPITFSIIILVLSIIGYFVFKSNLYNAIIGIVIGVAVFLFGFFESQKGWMSIDNNTLKIYGVQENIDTRQLKEITLKNDRIILTNIYGENKNSNQLNLNPSISFNIKKFLTEKLHNSAILIIDSVTTPV